MLPFAQDKYGCDRSVSLLRRVSAAVFEAVHYPWMLRDELALEIMRLMRSLHEDLRTAFYKAVLQRFVYKCDTDVLDEHGRGRDMPRFYNEGHVDYRRRLAAFRLWHSFAGWRQGWFRAFEFFGVTAQCVHTFTASCTLWSAHEITAFIIQESVSSGLKWLVSVERSDGSEDIYRYDADTAAWVEVAEATAANIEEYGNTAAEMNALDTDTLSELLPCGSIMFITLLENENWWAERGIFADVEATIYI